MFADAKGNLGALTNQNDVRFFSSTLFFFEKLKQYVNTKQNEKLFMATPLTREK